MRAYLSPLLLFLVAFLQYANTLHHDFAWDDKLVITGNAYTLKGISGLGEIFTHRVSVPDKNVYRPVPQALFAIEYQLSGGDPHVGHFFNVLWYAALIVIVFYFIRFVFPAADPLFAFLTALFFAVHPLHSEVVANIKSRDEILALFFGLPALMFLVKAAEKGKPWMIVPGMLSFILACMSKENAVSLLPLGLVIGWYRGGAFQRKHWRRAVPAILAGALGIGGWLYYSVSSVRSAAVHLDATVLNNIFLWTTESGKVTPTALVNIGRYLLLFLWPDPLIHMYGYNQVGLAGWSSPATIAMLALLAGTLRYVWTSWRRKPPAIFGLCFFAATYAVYSNLFVLAPDTMADRYLFMPSLGLCIIVVQILLYLKRWLSFRPAGVLAGCSLLALACFIRTLEANRDWKNDYTLIYNRIGQMENNAAAQATYGYMLDKESVELPQGEERREKKEQAMQAYRRAVQIYPDFAMPWLSMGRIFAQQGIYDKAELCFLKALDLEPAGSETIFCLGTLNYTVGDNPMATAYLERAVLLDPSMEPAYVLLGRAYLQEDSLANLGSVTETAEKWFPGNADLHALRGIYFYRAGRLRDALESVDKALRLDPGNVTALSLRPVLLRADAAGVR